MATILDTLIVELGLDPKKLTQGQQQAIASFKKTQEEALKTGKAIEGAAGRVTQYLGKMRNQAVAFAAAAFGASGIVQFIQQVTTSNAALGRSAELLGTSEEKLSTWRNAVKLAGGTAEGLQQTVAGLVNSFSLFGVTGALPESAKWFRALELSVTDVNGKLKPFDELILDISEKLSKMDKVTGATFARGLGIEESIIPFVLKGPAAMRAFLDEMEKANKVTKEAAAKSTDLEQAWVRTSENAKGFGNELVTGVSPALSSALRFYNNWFSNLRTLVGNVTSGEALRAKSDAGTPSVAVHALASSLQSSIPGLKEFTSFNDPFHAGMKSKHSEGLALDFTVSDPSKYAETAAAVRRRLTEMGIQAYVRDEHNDPSPYATGSHIHVQFANSAAANKFNAATGGGGAAAIANAGSMSGGGNKSTVIINGGINVTVPGGDSAEISDNIYDQIKRRGEAGKAEPGPS